MNKRVVCLLAFVPLAIWACSSRDSGTQQSPAPSAQSGANVFSAETRALDKAKSVNKIIQQSDQKMREAIDREGQ